MGVHVLGILVHPIDRHAISWALLLSRKSEGPWTPTLSRSRRPCPAICQHKSIVCKQWWYIQNFFKIYSKNWQVLKSYKSKSENLSGEAWKGFMGNLNQSGQAVLDEQNRLGKTVRLIKHVQEVWYEHVFTAYLKKMSLKHSVLIFRISLERRKDICNLLPQISAFSFMLCILMSLINIQCCFILKFVSAT